MSPHTLELVVHKRIRILNCNYESYKMFVSESLYFLFVSIDAKVVTYLRTWSSLLWSRSPVSP